MQGRGRGGESNGHIIYQWIKVPTEQGKSLQQQVSSSSYLPNITGKKLFFTLGANVQNQVTCEITRLSWQRKVSQYNKKVKSPQL